jgi:hypothetical protein
LNRRSRESLGYRRADVFAWQVRSREAVPPKLSRDENESGARCEVFFKTMDHVGLRSRYFARFYRNAGF